jgi:hypothetical protein
MGAARATKPGRYADGGGLYLQVSQSGTRAWLFRFMRNGVARHMGLGSVRDVSLAEARSATFFAASGGSEYALISSGTMFPQKHW